LIVMSAGLVGALSLDVTRLLALIASTLAAGLGWAVSGEMANLATVVALLTLGAVTGHVAVTTAGVAGLSTLATTESTSLSTAVTAVTTKATTTLSTVTSLGAVAGNVTDLGALVALLRSTGRETATSSALSGGVGAVAGDVAWLTALVASLVLGTLGAFTAHVAFSTTVVALGWASGWAITSLVRLIATVVAAAALGLSTVGIHIDG
jgi:hypothetical protein